MSKYIHDTYRKIKRTLDRAKVWTAGVGKTVERKALFESFRGQAYADNPRAVSEALHKMAPEIRIIWALNGKDEYSIVPDYVSTVVRDSKDYYREFTTAAAFITNEALESCFVKKDGKQLFIQTWHGDRTFKKVLYDVWANRQRPEPILDELYTDYCVAGSIYGEKQYRSAFNYKGEVLLKGTPRDDCLCHIDGTRIHDVKKRLGLSDDRRYLIYAPTMRKENQSAKTDQPIQRIDMRRTLRVCKESYGGEWTCLLRAHPTITGLTGIEADGKEIIDVSGYPDMADLLLISDCLITDYSSCAGDYALLRRPLFLFQDDIEQYQEKERDFYFDMKDSPYLAAHSQNELEQFIKKTTLQDAEKNCDEILAFYGTKETGQAAEYVAKRIVDFCQKL